MFREGRATPGWGRPTAAYRRHPGHRERPTAQGAPAPLPGPRPPTHPSRRPKGVSGSGVNSFWMEGVWGTAAAPVVVTRAPGSRGVLPDIQSINVLNCTYLYFKDVAFNQVRLACAKCGKGLNAIGDALQANVFALQGASQRPGA